jgi:peptidoglycan/xylan/chitin deacetylase (PgdA/CDA1 family)
MSTYDSTLPYPRDLKGYGRHISMEGIYEYGSRAGVWRILREFEKRGLPLTVFGVATALQKHPELTAALQELGYDIACHGLKWIHYQNIDEATERAHMAEAMAIIQKLTGERPTTCPFG